MNTETQKTLNPLDSLKVNLVLLGDRKAAELIQEIQNKNAELFKALKGFLDAQNDGLIFIQDSDKGHLASTTFHLMKSGEQAIKSNS